MLLKFKFSLNGKKMLFSVQLYLQSIENLIAAENKKISLPCSQHSFILQ